MIATIKVVKFAFATKASVVLLGNFVVVEDNFCNAVRQRDCRTADRDNSRREAGRFTGYQGDLTLNF